MDVHLRAGRAMMSKGRTLDEVSELLEQGLDLYGRNEVEEAIRCWRKVLLIDPTNARAMDFLDCAGASSEPMTGLAEVIDLDELRAQLNFAAREGTPAPAAVSWSDEPPATEARPVRKSMIERLLKDERHEEALELLYQARARNPGSVGLSQSIRLLRERLALTYAAALGNLDWVPKVAQLSLAGDLGAQERQVLALIDGISSYGDIVASCSLGRLVTLRILCSLLEVGAIVGSRSEPIPPSVSATFESPSSRQPKAESAQVSDSLTQADTYEQLFSDATAAYLVRDYQRAYQLFQECCKRRPDDRRAQHNLNALKRRVTSA